jgi:hypothetical protein
MTMQADVIPAMERFFDAIEAKDMDAAMRIVEVSVDPDVQFNSVIADAFEGRDYQGHSGVRSWFSDLVDTFDVRYANRRFREIDPDTILLLTDIQLRGRESGADVPRQIGVLIELDGGLIRRITSFGTHDEAIAAVEAAP